MAKKRQILGILFLFILLALSSNANSKEDFSLSAQPSLSLCSCASQAYRIAITNTGDEDSRYTVQPSAESKEAIKANPAQFSLKPKQKAEVEITVTTSCSLQAGSAFQSRIIVNTNKGLAKALAQKYNIISCFDYSITKGNLLENAASKLKPEAFDGTYQICENSRSFAPLFFNNKDARANTYELSVEGAEWALPNANRFSVPSRKSAAVLVELNPPEGSEGKHKITVKSKSSAGSVANSAVLDVEVGKCYGLDLEIENKENKLCGGDIQEYNATIFNRGKFSEEIEFETKGAEWAGFDKTSVQVKANDKINIQFSAKPTSSAEGKLDVVAAAFLKSNHKIREEIAISFDITPKEECYKGEIIANSRITNKYSEQYAGFKVRNAGEREAKYRLSIDGVEWAAVEPAEVLLNPGQIWNANFHINPGNEAAEGDYDAVVNMEYRDTKFSKEVTIRLRQKSALWQGITKFYRFYEYYIYLLIAVLLILFLLRKRIYGRYKRAKARRARLNALKKARMARAALKQEKLPKPEKPRKEKKRSKWRIWIILLAVIIFGAVQYRYVLAYALFAKNFAGAYLVYILMGIAVAAVLIFLIEFYKPLFRMLRKK